MNRYALSFTVSPGAEPAVAGILRGYQRPPAGAAGAARPLLRRTSVFMAGRRVVRVLDVEGDIRTVMRHLAAQPQIRAVEEALDPYLATPRDLRTPEGVRAFLHETLLPAAPAPQRPAQPALEGQRCGLRYQVRPDGGEAAAGLLAGITATALRGDGGGPVAASTLFRRGDVVVGMLEADGDPDLVLEAVARAGAAALARDPATAGALAGVLACRADLTTVDGFRRFLAESRMELVTDRRVGVPA